MTELTTEVRNMVRRIADVVAERDALKAELAQVKASRERLRKAFIKVDGMYAGEINERDEAIQELRESDLTDAEPTREETS